MRRQRLACKPFWSTGLAMLYWPTRIGRGYELRRLSRHLNVKSQWRRGW